MSSKKKILILSSEYKPFRGGIGTYAREIGRAAAELGAEVILLAPNYHRLSLREEIDGNVCIWRFRGGPHSFRDVPLKFWLTYKAAVRTRFDIVHAVDWPFYMPVASLSRYLAPSKLATLHGTEVNQMAQPVRKLIVSSCGMLPRFDSLLCNSTFTQSLFLKHFGSVHNHSRVTLLGVSRFWFDELVNKNILRKELNIDLDAFMVITVGRITRRKGHLTTLNALSNLPDQIRTRLLWVIAGPDGENDYVNELKCALEKAPFQIRMLGALDEDKLRALYNAADLFCLTGAADLDKIEGFGLVFLEAGAASLPAIATRTGGVNDAIIDGHTGLLVNSSKAPDITIAAERIILDDQLRARLARNARSHASALSWKRCAALSYQLPVANSLIA